MSQVILNLIAKKALKDVAKKNINTKVRRALVRSKSLWLSD